MTNSKMLYTISNSLLTSSVKELDECRTHSSKYANDSWLACMVTSRVLARMASALMELKDQLEKADAPSEKDPTKFQSSFNAGFRAGMQERNPTPLFNFEGSDAPAARDQRPSGGDAGTEQD